MRLRRQGAALIVAILVLVLGGGACSSPVKLDPSIITGKAAQPTSGGQSRCAAIYVAALTTPKPIPGAFACQTTALQTAVGQGGIKTDADLAKAATASPVFASPHFLGPLPDHFGLEYRITVDGSPGLLFVWLDSTGKVAHFSYV